MVQHRSVTLLHRHQYRIFRNYLQTSLRCSSKQVYEICNPLLSTIHCSRRPYARNLTHKYHYQKFSSFNSSLNRNHYPNRAAQRQTPISINMADQVTSSSSSIASRPPASNGKGLAAGSNETSLKPEVNGEDNAGDAEEQYQPRYIDVGINLTDRMYQGFYHGRKHHEADLDHVIQRAQAVGCQKLMVTGSDLSESQRAVDLAKEYPGYIFATVGVHPCNASGLMNKPEQLEKIRELALEGKRIGAVTAFGEIGLDYDRLFLSDKDSQLRFFEAQLKMAHEIDLPLFLHSRAAEEDFNRLLFLTDHPRRGLVHSFTGTLEEMRILVEHGYDIGINGCSLKTEENLQVVKEVPLERLQIETDGPWCEIRASHASAQYLKTLPAYLADIPKDIKKEKWKMGLRIKGRNEPCAIAGVAWVIAQVKGVSFEEVCERSWENSMKMFRFDEAAALQEKWKAESLAQNTS